MRRTKKKVNIHVLQLSKKVKAKTIIAGFPGFGLVGTIVTGYLIDHLKTEQVGTAWFEELNATVALHEGKVIHPITIAYDKKNSIIVVSGITASQGVEWHISKHLRELAKLVGAQELITIEGVSSQTPTPSTNTFYYTTNSAKKKLLEKTGCKQLKEVIILGVTGALMINPPTTLTTIFTETHSQLPDSKAGAQVIETLDKYLGLDVDYAPLLKQAEAFEQKLKTVIQQGVLAQKQSDKKQESYIG